MIPRDFTSQQHANLMKLCKTNGELAGKHFCELEPVYVAAFLKAAGDAAFTKGEVRIANAFCEAALYILER